MKNLHIYAQYQWHDDAHIVGNRKALEDLIQTIRNAIDTGDSKTEAFVADGEGYNIRINCVDDKTFDEMQLPYTSEFAKKHFKNRTPPWNLPKKA